MDITIDARAALWYRGAGMGTYARGLIKGLEGTEKHRVNIILPQGNTALTKASNAIEDEGKRSKDFWERVQANPATVGEQCDIFHNLHNGFGLPLVKTCPTIVTIHDLIPLIMPEHCGSPYRETFTAEIAKTVEKADKIIATSVCTKKDIVNLLKVPPKKISVIYQGIDRSFRPLNKEAVKKELADTYNIDNDYILYVGGFNPRKNLKTLVEAFGLIQEEIPWNLLIVGQEGKRGEKIRELAAKITRPGRVIFSGYIPDCGLPLFYNGAKVFVYPSLYEGFGLPPLEAAACGTAVILSNTASLPEVMGDNAIYVDPLDREDLANAILTLYRNEALRLTLARNGLNHSRLFSHPMAAKKTLALYENLCR